MLAPGRFTQALAHPSEATQIAEQDRGLDLPTIAALDRTGDDRLGRPVAEKGPQQVDARAVHGGRLERSGKRLAETLDQLEMGVGKTVLVITH